VHFEGAGGQCRTEIPPGFAEFDPSAQEIARGFMAAVERGDLQLWASVILCGPFGFDQFADTTDGERLKELLWDASFGVKTAAEDIAFIANLAARD
jgi:hypothetical protein